MNIKIEVTTTTPLELHEALTALGSGTFEDVQPGRIKLTRHCTTWELQHMASWLHGKFPEGGVGGKTDGS